MADFTRPLYEFESEDLRPSARDWLRHTAYFLLTLFTATVAGITIPFGQLDYISAIPAPTNHLEWFFIVPYFFAHAFGAVFRAVSVEPGLLLDGFAFSLSLLAILTAHEFGHYIAARIYGVKTTLPYFIPLPFLSPAGTLGAVIKMQSPTPTQRATFDIGVAGPLAGFVVIIPIAIIGLATMQMVPSNAVVGQTFADPLLTRLLGAFIGVDPTRGLVNPFYSAAWVGALVTSLNLLPVGQLDGGHATYAVFGQRAHRIIGRIAFAAMVCLTVLGYQLYGTPSTLIFTILLPVLLKIPHPEPLYNEPLDAKRKIIAVITLAVFVLSFMPFPIQVH